MEFVTESSVLTFSLTEERRKISSIFDLEAFYEGKKKKKKKEVFYAYSTGNTVPYVKWLGHRTNSTYFWTHIFGQKYSGTGT